MLIKTVLKMSVFVGVAMAVVACGQPQQDVSSGQPVSAMRTGADYQKPGAAVRLAHNYGGKSEVGVAETVLLSFKPEYDLQQMTVELTTSSDLLQIDYSAYSGAATGGQAVEIPTTLLANQEGRYFVNMSVVAVTEEGRKSSRSFSLSVVVGDVPVQKADSATLPDGKGVRILSAEEKIR